MGGAHPCEKLCLPPPVVSDLGDYSTFMVSYYLGVLSNFLNAPAAAPMLQLQLLCSGRRRRQKGAPHVRRGQQWRRCKGVNNDDGGRTDFANAELVDDAGDVAAAPVARDLARGATIPAGGKGGGGRGGGSASASGWLSRCLKLCRRRLSSSRHSAASCPLTHLLLFASCTPTLPFASCLPAGYHVARVVTPPPTSPCDFTSASSSPSGRRNLQCPLVAPPPPLVL